MLNRGENLLDTNKDMLRRASAFWRRKSGKSIRRQIERRFDAVLGRLASGNPELVLRQPHARWLLDNSHLVRQALQQIETDLPANYYRELRTVRTPDSQKTPRIFTLVDKAIDQYGLPLESAVLEQQCFQQPYAAQTHTALTIGELWAVPTALRISLLKRLCDAAERATSAGAELTDANAEAETAIIAGCISSIRTVFTLDWQAFVERTSVVEHELRKDPSSYYKQMDFETRDSYRQSVERTARRFKQEQMLVAETAVRLARNAAKESAPEHRRHVGYYLVDDGRVQLENALGRRAPLAVRLKRHLRDQVAELYLTAIIGLALFGAVVLFFGLRDDDAGPVISAVTALIALIPLLSVSSGAVNLVASLLVPPRRLPKLDLGQGIGTDQQAIVVVPMLLSSPADIAENLKTLELNYLGNSDPLLRFALLSDFVDAPEAETGEDKALLDMARSGIDDLNHRYASDGGRPFMLFHRHRLWNENAQCWMGWERKRGKLEEFNELLRGATGTSFELQHGDRDVDFAQIRYVITLDADSYIPTGTAARLIGTMAHPLNQARFEDGSDRMAGGYTVLQPRLETNPVTGAETRFARIFAGDVMLDLYTHAVSDVYQDLFGEAIFAGKGIYDLDAFRRTVAGHIPANTVLSHDLLEGLLGRAGLTSDIVLLENYPSTYLSYLKRLHRWIRGDWQLLPWLTKSTKDVDRPFRPGLIGRWKLFDNLRRSLVIPSILLILILGWLWLPGHPMMWTLIFALFPGLPILLRLTLAFRTSLWRWGTIESSARNLIEHAGADAGRWLLALVFLPAEASVVVDAIARTIYRVTHSQNRMLEWSTAAHVDRMTGRGSTPRRYWRSLWFGPAVAMLSCIGVVAFNPQALVAAAPLLILWLLSPYIAFRLSHAKRKTEPVPMSDMDVRFLRGIARDTWRFFERFVGPESSWLPPDNVQEYPQRIIAERTSPTNIGMMLLSTVTAYDLGYIGKRQLLSRLTSHLESIQKLQKHRGHLYNWYSTRDRSPLEPYYVSTVDSGNLIAAYVILQQTLEELPDGAHPISHALDGLSDDLTAMRRQLFTQEPEDPHSTIKKLIRQIENAQSVLSKSDDPHTIIHEFEHSHCTPIEDAFLKAFEHDPQRWSAEEIAHFRENSKVSRQRVRMILNDIEHISPWSEHLPELPGFFHRPGYRASFDSLNRLLDIIGNSQRLPKRFEAATHLVTSLLDEIESTRTDAESQEAIVWLHALQQEIERATIVANELEESRKGLIKTLADLIDETDFRFLYDQTRHLFRVGYNASTGEGDSSFYDLLASEARIASFVAIAKGDVPAKHWMHLGRPLTRIRGLRVLLSWSATAFEYLMPRLVMHSPASGLLNQSCEGVVNEQIRFAEGHGIPWGVSESGYALFDDQSHYQYFAFGIPKLGLKWDQGERLVISSYSSALALAYAPAKTVSNLRRLIDLSAAGHYGLFEALDFGEVRKPRTERPQVVQSYMAHHQGMILVAIGNLLHHDAMPRRFHEDPRIASVEHLLYERLPQRLQTRPLERLPSPLKELPVLPATVAQWPVDHQESELAVLSNGRLSSRISDQGGGALFWRGLAATRWAPLSEGTLGGNRIYLKDLDHDRINCLGGEILHKSVDTLFAPHAVEFRARSDELLMRSTTIIAPDHDTEIRRVTITNDGPTMRRVQLTSYCEPVLAPEPADQRHPAFSKLFIESQMIDDEQVLLFRRRQRDVEQSPIYLAHCAVVDPRQGGVTDYELDRSAFLGRAADSAEPQALMDHSNRPSSHAERSLDPCASLSIGLEVAPHSTVQCAFLTSVATRRSEAMNAITAYRSLERIEWTIETARLQSERELTGLRIDSSQVQAAFRLLAKILWPVDLKHIGTESTHTLNEVQGVLWRHGISGDRPIITHLVDSEDDLEMSDKLLNSVRYLSQKGYAIDAVFIDESAGGYSCPTNDRLNHLVDTHLPHGRERDDAKAFIIPVSNLSQQDKTHLVAASRVSIDSRKDRSLKHTGVDQDAHGVMPSFVPQPSAPLSDDPIEPVELPDGLLWQNRYGGMLPSYDGYALLISGRSRPPAPWCNILTNRDFGTLISDTGSMCTWWGNSSEKRLTPWSNDAVLDSTGEALYVRDEETARSWSLMPLSANDETAYRVTHHIGETVIEHNRHGLEQRLRVFVDPDDPVKYMQIRFTNRWQRVRRLTVTFAAQWVLDNAAGINAHLLMPDRDEVTGALLVRNSFLRQAGAHTAFVGSNLKSHGVSCDGHEFFGQHRSWKSPTGLAAVGLSDRIGNTSFPCAIYQVHIDLAPDETTDFHFVLGAAEDRASAVERIAQSVDAQRVNRRRSASQSQWDDLLGTWQVATPDRATDAVINRWLLYQVIASRLWGRLGFYQASGGFGFRDQLQDVMALLDTDPDATRAQILKAASRQFEQGDVLHWWHEAPLRGVRTRCSDDLLWLPYAVSEYMDATDDASILNKQVPFLSGEPLSDRELERYAEFQTTEHTGSLYDHCCRAIDARIAFGEHGLPFMGTGDWNDGLNRVGEKGRGESVWMAWFLVIVCRRFAPLCRLSDDNVRADHYETVATDLLRHTQSEAWTGEWYLRGYFDNGAALGAPGNAESEIDLNAQTWAVLSDPSHTQSVRSMQAANEHLIDSKHRLIKLLAPPFDTSEPDPGYIRAYPPGVRENGGQYTHAAVWAALAAAEMGDSTQAMRWFDWLNPLNRVQSDEDLQHYRLEPYVTAGDIYGAGSLAGRGGWSWYTGSAAWLYRIATRHLLGLQRHGDTLFIRPCLPESWPEFSATLRHGGARYRFYIHDPAHIDSSRLYLLYDEETQDAPSISLKHHGDYCVRVFPSDSARSEWLSEQEQRDRSTHADA